MSNHNYIHVDSDHTHIDTGTENERHQPTEQEMGKAYTQLITSNEMHNAYKVYSNKCVKEGWETMNYVDWFETYNWKQIETLAYDFANNESLENA